MKWYGIDQDVYTALVDLITEAYQAAKDMGDDDSVSYYSFLLGELEEAKIIGKGRKMNDEETARMMKLQRYLRMLQQGLKDPKDANKKKRRQVGRDVVKPKKQKPNNIIGKVSLEEVRNFLKDDPELTPVERFELYYDERQRRENEGFSLNKICKDLGIDRNKKS